MKSSKIKMKKILTSSLVTASLFGSFGIGYLTSHLVEKNNNSLGVNNDFETDFIENGIKLSKVNAYTNEAGESVQIINYSFEPANATNKEVEIDFHWAPNLGNNEEFWQDKLEENYVSYELNKSDQTITLICKQPFETTLQLDIHSIEDLSIYASVEIDYDTRYSLTFDVEDSDISFANVNEITLVQDIDTNRHYITDGTNIFEIENNNLDSFITLANSINVNQEVIQYGSINRVRSFSDFFGSSYIFDSSFNLETFISQFQQFFYPIYRDHYELMDPEQYYGDNINNFMNELESLFSGVEVTTENNLAFNYVYPSSLGLTSSGKGDFTENIAGDTLYEKYYNLLHQIGVFQFNNMGHYEINDSRVEMALELLANSLANIDEAVSFHPNSEDQIYETCEQFSQIFENIFTYEFKPIVDNCIVNGGESFKINFSYILPSPFKVINEVTGIYVNNSQVIY